MLGYRKDQPWSKDNCQDSCRGRLHRSGKFKQRQIGLKKIYFCVLTLLALGIPNVAFALTPCDYYASPTGSSNGLTETTPFKIADFWSVAGPGKTLCLLDGTYIGGSSMITPPQNLNGVAGYPITVKALNDGKAIINGEGNRRPVNLYYNNYFILEGFNAHDSNQDVIQVARSEHSIVRRVVAWNAPIDQNAHVYIISNSTNILLEDVSGFGTGRKIFLVYRSTDNTIRRAWGRWEGSIAIGPKHVFAPIYNAYGTMIENSIGTWTGEKMTGSVDQPYDILGVDGIADDWSSDRKVRVRLLGNIMYENGGGTFHPAQQVFFTKHDEIHITDLATYFPEGQYSSKRTATLSQCWTTATGGVDCPNPNLTITNFTSIGGAGYSISSHWQKTNVKAGSSVNAIYPQGENLFVNSGNVGATICKRYVDGVLTQEPLWPWPMDQRTYDALQQAGKTPFHITEVIEGMFGTIPSECKKTGSSQIDEPPAQPSGLQFAN